MQPNNGSQWIRISGTATGTATVKAEPCIVTGVLIGSGKEGSVALYDSSDGTTAKVMTAINCNLSGSQPAFLPMNAQMKVGLTYVKTGTTDLTVYYV